MTPTATLEKKKHELAFMDIKEGDVKLQWDPDDKDEVAATELTFEKLKKKGYQFFKMNFGGKKGEKIAKFDKDIESILGIPHTVGG